MSDIRSAVYVAPPVPFQLPNSKSKGGSGGLWSPIASTLIYSGTEAVLVDTPITIQQTKDLIAWIERIAPERKLRYIYITHGHGDHFFGLPVLIKQFPKARPIATAATLRHIEQQVEEKNFQAQWNSRFPGQIPRPFVLPEALPPDNQFFLENEFQFQAVEVGHTDTYDSTVLWVPHLRLAVCGDVAYGQVHQMLGEARTAAKRHEWVRAIEKVESLDPLYVVPGHCQEGEIHGRWHLTNTKQYIRDFEKVLEGEPKSPREIVATMTRLYPDRFNTGAVILGAMGAFQTAKESKM